MTQNEATATPSFLQIQKYYIVQYAYVYLKMPLVNAFQVKCPTVQKKKKKQLLRAFKVKSQQESEKNSLC